ncbi:unnamed protein product [Closterium sp. NIES-64]|nr:unnamed protein product [Closterium sp. NIES-64]
MHSFRNHGPTKTDHRGAAGNQPAKLDLAIPAKLDSAIPAILPWHVLLVLFVTVQAYSLRTLVVYPPSIFSASDGYQQHQQQQQQQPQQQQHQEREWSERAEPVSAAEQAKLGLEGPPNGEAGRSDGGSERSDAMGSRGRWGRVGRMGRMGKGGEDGKGGEGGEGVEGGEGGKCTLLSLPSLPPVLHVHLLSDPGQKKKKGVTTAEDVEFFLRRRFPSCKLEYIGGQPGQAKEKGEGIVWPVCSDHLRPRGVVYSFGVGPNLLFEGEMTLRGQQVFVFDPFVNDTAFASMLQPIKGLSPRRSPQFRPFALGPRDGTREAAVLRLRTFMCMHSHRWIDILRLDIAGLELDLCENAATAAAAGGGGGGLGGGDAFSTSVGDLTQHGAAALAEKTPVGPTPGSVPIGQVAVRFHAELAGRDGAKRRQKCEETFAAWGLKKVHVMGDGSTVLFARTDAAAAL